MSIENTVLEEGLRLLAAGCSVFGITWKRDENGTPITEVRPNGHCKKAVDFPAQWRSYEHTPIVAPALINEFNNNGRNTLCLVMGAVSGNLHCTDVDAPELYDAFMAKACEAIKDFSDRVYIENTFSGGKHIIYAVDPAYRLPGNKKIAKSEEEYDLIETRGEGGIIFTAPSYGYTPEHGDVAALKDNPLSEAEFNTLMEVIASFDRRPAATSAVRSQAEGAQDGFDDNVTDLDIFSAGIISDPRGLEQARKYTDWATCNRIAVEGCGGSNTAMTYFNMICWGLKVSPVDALSICQSWNQSCNPPWSREELVHKIASAWRRSGKDRPLGYAIGTDNYEIIMNGVNLRVDKKGKIVNDLITIQSILQQDEKYADMAGYNELWNNVGLTRCIDDWKENTPLKNEFRRWLIMDICNRYDGLQVREDNLKIVLSALYTTKAYNPFRDYVQSCTWDGKKRVETLLIDAFGVEDTVFAREAITKWLLAAYGRQIAPGMKFDYTLALTGREGLGKSTFLNCLFDPMHLGATGWHGDGFTLRQLVDDKVFIEDSSGKVGIELAEFAGSKKVEVDDLKNALTKCIRQKRMAYGDVSDTFKVRQVFFITTNETEFLRSHTGNRRFWVFTANKENVFSLLTTAYVGQIWGEVRAMYDSMCDTNGYFNPAQLLLSADAEVLARGAQQDAVIEDPWQPAMAQYLGAVKEYTDVEKTSDGYLATPVYLHEAVHAADLWGIVCEPITGRKATPFDSAKMKSYVVNRLNWSYARPVIGNKRLRGFVRPAEDEARVTLPLDAIPASYKLELRNSIPGDITVGYGIAPRYQQFT